MIKTNIALSKIISFLNTQNYSFYNNEKLKITGFKSLESAEKGDITFCSLSNKKGLKLISLSNASVIICHKSLKNKIKNSKINLIFVENPRLSFIRCMKKFFDLREKFEGIHSTATVKTEKIGKNVFIGPFVSIGQNVSIGDNSIIHSNVVIYENTIIGKNVTVNSNAVIGIDLFSFERNETKKLEKFPFYGGIEIKDDVEIGSNVCIERGNIENTVIGKGTKIDNLVLIGHNSIIGSNCMIAGNSTLGGSCIIDDNVFIGLSVTIKQGIRISTNAFVGMGSVVTKDVKKNSTVFGVPAKVYKSKKKR